MMAGTTSRSRMFQVGDKAYRPIPDFPDYFASEDGTILSTKLTSPHILSQIKDPNPSAGLYVFLYRDRKMYKGWVHRLVLMAWDRQPEEEEECRHLDGNPIHNDLSNLRWGTSLQNSLDRVNHGRSGKGETGPTHKLTAAQVIEIRANRKYISLRALAKQYGVSHTAIRRAALGINWGHLSHE
jgi:hypothetical protein